MLIPSLTFAFSACMAFLGQLFMYFAKTEESAPAWLQYWGYVFLGFAALFVLVTIVEFFKSIVRACRRRRAQRGDMPPKHHRRRKRR